MRLVPCPQSGTARDHARDAAPAEDVTRVDDPIVGDRIGDSDGYFLAFFVAASSSPALSTPLARASSR